MIALLEDKKAVKNFFKDLLSETEAVMFARRIRIAKLLLRGMSYQKIREALHASDITIAGVHRWLQSGFGGYESSLPLLAKEFEKRKRTTEKYQKEKAPYSFEWLKRRYPLHFLLFNLFDKTYNSNIKRKKE